MNAPAAADASRRSKISCICKKIPRFFSFSSIIAGLPGKATEKYFHPFPRQKAPGNPEAFRFWEIEMKERGMKNESHFAKSPGLQRPVHFGPLLFTGMSISENYEQGMSKSGTFRKEIVNKGKNPDYFSRNRSIASAQPSWSLSATTASARRFSSSVALPMAMPSPAV